MEETKKVCFKCGRTLPLDEFYKHPQMGDGHLNKCKDCTRNDTRIQYDRNIKDPSFIERERVRGRDKYRRYKYGSTTNISDFQKEKRKLYPRCRSAKQIIGIKTDEGIELHHWNYNLNTSVILCRETYTIVYIIVSHSIYKAEFIYSTESHSIPSKSTWQS